MHRPYAVLSLLLSGEGALTSVQIFEFGCLDDNQLLLMGVVVVVVGEGPVGVNHQRFLARQRQVVLGFLRRIMVLFLV